MTIIETPRLLLRQLTPDDADDLAALYADPEVMRFFDGLRTRAQAAEEIARCREAYERVGYHFWAAIHKDDGRFIGRCGLLPQQIDGRPEAEVAYMIARAYWNRGLGTEAARAIKEYGFAITPFPRLVSIIAPDNLSSIRVAEKNGMRFVKPILFKGYRDHLYAADRAAR